METQEQEVEALKKWWKDNGRVVVTGIVFGLGGVIGWNWWLAYEQGRAEEASSMYSEVVNASNSDDHPRALSQAKQLMEAFPGSGYAALGALVGARSAQAAKLSDEAQGQLQWVIQNAEIPQVKDVARVRLARVLRGDGKSAEALERLGAVESKSFGAITDELRGDIAVDAKNNGSAAEAYRAALERDDLDGASRQRLELKLADLGQAASAAQ